eukprot:TRINITY_DN6282_c0_g2_i1.p2 TRINITY_DN6282_c0_g2~~TRINITY_DN6282_c0_g2_i1.p2  ORF type:complete len:101 (+),score=3.84 TRINITY_DN6282_c0_g2_i1:362-664(+)
MKFTVTLTTDIFLFTQCIMIYYLSTIQAEVQSYRYSIGQIYLFVLSLQRIGQIICYLKIIDFSFFSNTQSDIQKIEIQIEQTEINLWEYFSNIYLQLSMN